MLRIDLIKDLRESEEIWFWISIFSLILLAFSEVMSRRAVSRKEEYIETHGNELADRRVQKTIQRLGLKDEAWFWISIFSLLSLGVSEVISHHFASNKDDVVTASELESADQNNTKIEELRSSVQLSRERIIDLKNEITHAEHELSEIRLQIRKAKDSISQNNQPKLR